MMTVPEEFQCQCLAFKFGREIVAGAPDYTHIASPDAWWRKIAKDCRANSMHRVTVKEFFTLGVFYVFGVQGFLTTVSMS